MSMKILKFFGHFCHFHVAFWVNCLVNSDNERDPSLLNSSRVGVNFFEGHVALSYTSYPLVKATYRVWEVTANVTFLSSFNLYTKNAKDPIYKTTQGII